MINYEYGVVIQAIFARKVNLLKYLYKREENVYYIMLSLLKIVFL